MKIKFLLLIFALGGLLSLASGCSKDEGTSTPPDTNPPAAKTATNNPASTNATK